MSFTSISLQTEVPQFSEFFKGLANLPCQPNTEIPRQQRTAAPFYITSRLNVMQAAVHNISGRQSHNGSDTELFLSLINFRRDSVRKQ